MTSLVEEATEHFLFVLPRVLFGFLNRNKTHRLSLKRNWSFIEYFQIEISVCNASSADLKLPIYVCQKFVKTRLGVLLVMTNEECV